MSRIVVEYNPPISHDTQKVIREEVTPSMVSNDEKSCKYEISAVADVLIDLEELGNTKDLFLINDLINQGVHYIEF